MLKHSQGPPFRVVAGLLQAGRSICAGQAKPGSALAEPGPEEIACTK